MRPALVLLALMACFTPKPVGRARVPQEAPAPTAELVAAPGTDNDQVPSLPMGEEPPPPRTSLP